MMQIKSRIVDDFVYLERRYLRLKEAFANFANGTEYFSDGKCPVRGVTITHSETGEYFDATFASIRARFQFLPGFAADNSLVGKVVCILQAPIFGETKPTVGSFTFNGQGIADLDVPPGSDKIEISYSAPEIVLHYLDRAMHLVGLDDVAAKASITSTQ